MFPVTQTHKLMAVPNIFNFAGLLILQFREGWNLWMDGTTGEMLGYSIPTVVPP